MNNKGARKKGCRKGVRKSALFDGADLDKDGKIEVFKKSPLKIGLK
jgi:hypothetical protein